MLEAVGVVTVAAIGRTATWLHIGDLPGLRAQGAQGRGRMERARPHLRIVGLQDDATLLRPIPLQRQHDFLECDHVSSLIIRYT